MSNGLPDAKALAARLTPAEQAALAAFEQLKLPLRGNSDRAAREVRSCTDCGLCCEFPRNEMKASPLEALAVAMRILSDPKLAGDLPAIRAGIRATIERHGLREVEDDGRAYTCPLLAPDKTCRVHGEGQPLGCVVFVPFTREHCDFRWQQLEEAGAEVGSLNDELYGVDTWPVHALPVALEKALDRLLGS